MKVKDLLKEIKEQHKIYPDFLEWDIYTEQCNEKDKKNKRRKNGQNWDIIDDDWEYFRCEGFYTKFPNKKIFTINVNY